MKSLLPDQTRSRDPFSEALDKKAAETAAAASIGSAQADVLEATIKAQRTRIRELQSELQRLHSEITKSSTEAVGQQPDGGTPQTQTSPADRPVEIRQLTITSDALALMVLLMAASAIISLNFLS